MKIRVRFITGTDTGVGKTLLTGLLLEYLRREGIPVLALKPFCSGSRADAEFLWKLQDGDVPLNEINPYHFRQPLAPLAAGGPGSPKLSLNSVIRGIETLAKRFLESTKNRVPDTETPVLLIEGIGGVLVPLGRDFSVLDLIRGLETRFLSFQAAVKPSAGLKPTRATVPWERALWSFEVIVVSRNALGTINHTMLTVQALQHADTKRLTVVIMQPGKGSADSSSATNPLILSRLLAPVSVEVIPFLGSGADSTRKIKINARNCSRILRKILGNPETAKKRR